MHRHLALLCCLLLPLLAPAQTQPDCAQMLRDGDALMARRDPPLEEALRCYLNALNCNSQLAGVVGPKVQGVFEAIKRQKESEQKAKQTAEERLVAIQQQARAIQAKTLASQATSLMTQRRYYEALMLADQSNELVPSGDLQALMMRAYEALQEPGSCRLAKSFTSRLRKISQLFFNQNMGVLIATDQNAGASVLYDLSGNEVRETPLPGIVTNVFFSPDHRRFVVLNHKNEMTLWDADCRKIADLPLLFFNEKCKVEFSPCGHYLLYGNGFSGKLWSADGDVLVDGADMLRPVFTESFYHPGLNGGDKTGFIAIDHTTYLITSHTGNKDYLWDLALLMRGYKENSLVKVHPEWMDNPAPKTSSEPETDLLNRFTFLESADFPFKYLVLGGKNGYTLPITIKRDHAIVAYTPDTTAGMLATATDHGEIAIWQFNWSLGFKKHFRDKCLARFDPLNGRVLVLESPYYAHLLDLSGRELFQQPVYHSQVTPVLNGTIFDTGGNQILSWFGTVCSIHDREGQLQRVGQFPRIVSSAVFANDDKSLLVTTDSAFYRLGSDGSAATCVFQSKKSISASGISPPGNATWLRMQDSTVVIISDQEPLGQVLPQRLSDGHFSPAGNFFVAELPDKSVALFTKAGKPVSLPELASGIDLSPNDRFLLLNYKSGKSELRTKDSRVWKTLLTNMTGLFSPDNRYVLLFNGPNSNLELLDLQTATSLAFPSKGNILSVAFSSDDQYVALAFDSKVVELRRTDGKLVATIPEIGSVRFSPQGHYLLIRKNNDARIFSMDGVQMVAFDRQGSISNFEFSSDDQWLVISGFEGDVKTLPLPVGLHQYLKF